MPLQLDYSGIILAEFRGFLKPEQRIAENI